MADTIDLALADQQEQQQSNPDIESLVNMDTESAKQVADSVYRAAPVASLVTGTPKQAEREGKMRSAWKTSIEAMRRSRNPLDRAGAYLAAPLVRAALSVVDAQSNTFALKGSQQKAKDVLANALGDEEYRHIQGDGVTIARKALDSMGPDDNTAVQSFIQGVAQFAMANALTPEVGAEKALAGAVAKVPKLAKYAGKVGKLGESMARGAVVDATGFDPHQERLANLFVGAPLGIGSAARWLAANPNDSDAVGRFKASLEGMITSVGIDLAVAAVKKGGVKGASKVADWFTPDHADAPRLADFASEGTAKMPVEEPLGITITDDGKLRVEPNEVAEGKIDTSTMPVFDTLEEAQGFVAQANYAARNTLRPRIELSTEQSRFARTYAMWVKRTGKMADVINGTMDGSTGPLHGGISDVNFRYDTNPEEWGNILVSLSHILRDEIEGVRTPKSIMHDPKGGKNISHAETLAGTVKNFDDTTPDAHINVLDRAADEEDMNPYRLLAARMMRQNLSAQAEQLARQLEMPGAAGVVHEEFTKVANTLVNLYAREARLAGAVGRTLESRKIKGGMFGAFVDKAALARSLKRKNVDPLNIIKFNLIDDAALSPDEISKIEQAAKKKSKRTQKLPERTDADVSDMEVPVVDKSSGASRVGTNTYTLLDEASTKIDDAIAKLELGDVEGMKPATDAQASKAVAKDGERMDRVAKASGVTAEDFQLAKERLAAMKQTIAEKRKAGGKIINLSEFGEDELDDLASMHVERVKKLADAQRESPLVPKKVTDVYMNRRQLRAMARQLTYVPRDEKERAKVLETILGISKEAAEEGADVKPSTWEKVVSYRAAAMLSSPKTGFVNFFSAIGQSYYRPTESFMGAAARGDSEGMKTAFDLLMGTLKSHQDAWKMARESFEKARPMLSERDPSMPRPDVWRDSSAPVKAFMDALGVTGRFMTSGDEFAQQLSYRGHVYAQSMRKGRELGLAGEQLKNLLDDDMTRAFNEHQQGVNPAALSYAQDVTLRRPLEGGIGGHIEDFARTNKVGRIMFPFVRIPVNLVRYQMDRTPVLGLLTSRNRKDIAAGGMQMNEAIGRQVAGVMFWGSGLAMADAGIITGGGPSDPELRRTWLNVNQPYSIKLPGTDKWVSYRRFEPLSTPLGIMADFHQMLGEIDEDGGDKDVGEITSAFLAGIGQNLLSKTYLKSVSDLFYALGSGKSSAMEGFLASMASSFVPQVVQSGLDFDDQLRDAQSLVDRVKSRIPGLSSTLEPRRNIYGEKVMKPAGYFQRAFNPYTVRDDDADAVDRELLRLGEQMSMPLSKKFGVELKDRELGVDGKQSPYDRWMELMSKEQDGEPTLRQKLREFVQSDEYKELSDNVNGYQGTKSLAVEAIVRAYRAKAFAQMIEENPKVMEQIMSVAGERAAVLSGDPDMAEALTKKGTPVQRNSLAKDATAFIQ